MAQLTVRIAKQSDLSLIARLCRRAVGKSDYVLRILPNIIDLTELFLAWEGDELAGMTSFDQCMDGSGWLGMARVDPAWRGRGVAISLQQKITAYARRRGARIVRLAVWSWNTPSIRACEEGGFKQVCEAAHIACNLRTRSIREKAMPSHPSPMQLQLLLKSSYLAKTQGYIWYRQHFMKLTKAVLTKLRDQGELYLTEDTALIISRPDRLFRVPWCSLTILEGPMAKSLNQAKKIAEGMHGRILSSCIPYSPYHISVAKRLGFTSRPLGRGKHILVFEKKV